MSLSRTLLAVAGSTARASVASFTPWGLVHSDLVAVPRAVAGAVLTTAARCVIGPAWTPTADLQLRPGIAGGPVVGSPDAPPSDDVLWYEAVELLLAFPMMTANHGPVGLSPERV